MFTKNIKDSFTASLLSAVSGVLGEAKKTKCAEGCECEACEPEETQEGYMPTNDMPSAKDRATAGKLGALLKRERDAKEKKEPNGVKTEEADMPFDKPYRKTGERKDEYGNKVKNVAKHLAKKAMKANEEVEEIEEKRGLWDNIHAKRERIEAGSGERMRKPGSKGAPSAADLKASQKEEVSIDNAFEQIDEISKPTLGRYINKAKNSIDLTAWRQGHKEAGAGNPSKQLEKKLSKRHKGIETAVNKLTKEDSEQIDEGDGTGTYSWNAKHKKHDELVKAGFGHQAFKHKDGMMHTYWSPGYKHGALQKVLDEEVEVIDELSKDTMGRYIKKAATKIGTQGVTAGLKIAKDERSQKNFDTIGKRERGIATAVKKLTKEEQDFIDALNDADMDQIDEVTHDVDHMPGQTMSASDADKQTKKVHDDWAAGAAARAKGRAEAAKRKLAKEEVEELDELSKDAMLKYLHANKHKNTKDGNPRRDLVKSMRGTDMAVRKYTAKPGSKSVRVPATEEVELDEARGRPKKAGARDFTVHPKTKEKLMHNNPAHMAKIERLQKNGILPKPKTEANQHVIQQLQRAKLSMRGGETVNFTHGDPTHVSGTHASKLLDKYAGMKPDEKEAFQKKIGHSHANLKSEL